jgi:Flp pilus assembly pilin Flp
MKLMIGRMATNSREYPRFTLLVVCVYLVGAMMTPVLFAGDTLGSVLRWTGVGLLAVLALDILTYIWIVADTGRSNWFVDCVNDFEGKNQDDECQVENCEECEILEEDNLWDDERGQDIAEYAVMLAVILAIALGTIHLIGSNVNTVFSQIGSKIQ